MPVYDYECGDCGVFSALRPLAECDAPCPCPVCEGAARRAFVRMPGMALMDGGRRQAFAVNEKARHEPGRSSAGHGAGCSCCKPRPGKTASIETRGGMAKSFPGARPWMISH